MNKSVCIVVLTGLPATGKTSLARKLYRFLSAKDCVVQCVSFDELVTLEKQSEIAQSTASETTRECRLLMKNTVESFVTCYEFSLKRIVIVDDNNYYRSMRYEYYQLAAQHCVGYLQVFVRSDVDVAISSNGRRPAKERVPSAVIAQMHAKFEVPREAWENCVTVESEEVCNQSAAEFLNPIQSIWNRIQESIQNPVLSLLYIEEKKEKSEQSRMCNNRNVLHTIDKILRKQISRLIRDHNSGNVRSLANELKQIRQTFMENIRTGDLIIPKEIPTEDVIDAHKLEDWITAAFLQRCPLL